MAILSKLTTMKALLGAIVIVFVFGTTLGGSVLAAPTDQTVFDDFESIDSSDFTVGTGDITALFQADFRVLPAFLSFIAVAIMPGW